LPALAHRFGTAEPRFRSARIAGIVGPSSDRAIAAGLTVVAWRMRMSVPAVETAFFQQVRTHASVEKHPSPVASPAIP
jgi:hypothetical protein